MCFLKNKGTRRAALQSIANTFAIAHKKRISAVTRAQAVGGVGTHSHFPYERARLHIAADAL